MFLSGYLRFFPKTLHKQKHRLSPMALGSNQRRIHAVYNAMKNPNDAMDVVTAVIACVVHPTV